MLLHCSAFYTWNVIRADAELRAEAECLQYHHNGTVSHKNKQLKLLTQMKRLEKFTTDIEVTKDWV